MSDLRSKRLATNASAIALKSAGWLERASSFRSSTGLTKPRPRNRAQTRLTAARAKNGFSGAVIHAASFSFREKRGLAGAGFTFFQSGFLAAFGQGGAA